VIIKKFEDVIAWQKAKKLTIDIYKNFEHCRDYNFKNQIQRATVSIMNNIAEGFERQTNKELVNFLYISKGSCGETRSMISLAVELKYLPREKAIILYQSSVEVSKIISGLIKTL